MLIWDLVIILVADLGSPSGIVELYGGTELVDDDLECLLCDGIVGETSLEYSDSGVDGLEWPDVVKVAMAGLVTLQNPVVPVRKITLAILKEVTYGAMGVRSVKKIAREKNNSNQQEKKNSGFFPESQRAHALVARGRAMIGEEEVVVEEKVEEEILVEKEEEELIAMGEPEVNPKALMDYS
ncbi:hypothetical protein AgCh_009614 [Apium graveolens]